ncbi:hypothetical protein BT63DRAFT_416062 [Microthyrium microscopicum]|uniref:Oxysterol-binding protein-like protein n=1 Tax=Microthyrium microscopicum TaxID=703497 RepID=A0A6A6U6B6_9PEZI|nr:hypothetical protein BT63DRAFT_416062 [Microthyrium microscopicum]
MPPEKGASKADKIEKAPNGTLTSPETAPVETEPGDGSKLKTFLGILRKFIGVSDLASIRFSLPAHLLEPTPNLEYWGYLDRPEAFISIGDSEDPTGRMLGVLRFWFTKDLKYVKGKPCKPYNSTLGEFFRCNWEVEDTLPELRNPASAPGSSAASISSAKSAPVPAPLTTKTGGKKIKLSYLTEQTSHHPPVSAWYIDCPEKDMSARGYDQIAAKFTGTSVRVAAGNHNHGIFISLGKWDEEYQLTHPAAHVGGLLRGTLSVTVADTCYVTCPQTKTKVILEYLEDGWLGGAKSRVQGVIFKYDPDNDIKGQKVKEVAEKDVIARIEGSWMDKIYYTLGSGPVSAADEKHLIVDLTPLFPVAKDVPPLEDQLPNESRRFWNDVTQAILNKQYSLATHHKVIIEERQRSKAAERKAAEQDWQPRFFTGAVTPVGRPELTKDGLEVLKGLHEGKFKLEENKEYGA